MSNFIGAFVPVRRDFVHGQTSKRGHREQENHPYQRQAPLRFYQGVHHRRKQEEDLCPQALGNGG